MGVKQKTDSGFANFWFICQLSLNEQLGNCEILYALLVSVGNIKKEILECITKRSCGTAGITRHSQMSI